MQLFVKEALKSLGSKLVIHPTHNKHILLHVLTPAIIRTADVWLNSWLDPYSHDLTWYQAVNWVLTQDLVSAKSRLLMTELKTRIESREHWHLIELMTQSVWLVIQLKMLLSWIGIWCATQCAEIKAYVVCHSLRKQQPCIPTPVTKIHEGLHRLKGTSRSQDRQSLSVEDSIW